MTFGQRGVNATIDVGQMKRAQPTGYGLDVIIKDLPPAW
jgi:hypothetical protein